MASTIMPQITNSTAIYVLILKIIKPNVNKKRFLVKNKYKLSKNTEKRVIIKQKVSPRFIIFKSVLSKFINIFLKLFKLSKFLILSIKSTLSIGETNIILT